MPLANNSPCFSVLSALLWPHVQTQSRSCVGLFQQEFHKEAELGITVPAGISGAWIHTLSSWTVKVREKKKAELLTWDL